MRLAALVQKATLQKPVKKPPCQRTAGSLRARRKSIGRGFGSASVVNCQVPAAAGRAAPSRERAVTRMVCLVAGRSFGVGST